MRPSVIELPVFRFVALLRNFLDRVEVIQFSVRQNYSLFLFLHLLTLIKCMLLHISELACVDVLNACVTCRLFIAFPSNHVTKSGL